MAQYILRRLIQAVVILFVLSLVFFALVNLAPGGPLVGYGQGRRMPPEKLQILKRQLGLDRPMPVQYLIWLAGNDWFKVDLDGDGSPDGFGTRRGVLRGDFGFSLRTRQPVLDELAARVPNTVYLMTTIMLLSITLAIPIGVISAIKQYSVFDIIATTFAFAGQALPDFWLGLILILIFYFILKNPITGQPLLPVGGIATIGQPFSISDRLAHLVLPVTAGAMGWLAWYTRFLRSSMLDVINHDYLRTARAKGMTEFRVMYKHALRNALIPLVTLVALDLPYIFGGAVFIEMLFSWPGMGLYYYQSAMQRDYPVLMAILIFGGIFIILSNLLADILYGFLDPRIRYS